MSGDRWRWFNLVCVCANPAHMMALVRRGRGAHELCRFCSNIWSRAHEPIRKSLIRFSLCAENRCEASQSKGGTDRKWCGFRKAEFLQFGAAVSPCLSFASLLIFFFFLEQFVLTGKCHATLSALTPSLLATHCLSLSLSPFLLPLTSSLTSRVFSLPCFSHLIMSPFPLLPLSCALLHHPPLPCEAKNQ